MAYQKDLILPESYEELAMIVDGQLEKMMQFVVPIQDAEEKLALVTQSMRYSGKVVFLLGMSGIGKSTFIQSLTWRKFLPIPKIFEIDANDFIGTDTKLEKLYQRIHQISNEQPSGERGIFTVIINYLESLKDQPEEKVKAFFRDLNGLLRRKQLLIIWPVTEGQEVQEMVRLATSVSGTLFANDDQVLQFQGPATSDFPVIAKNTIKTLNEGLDFDDFYLTENDFQDVLCKLERLHVPEQTIRSYLRMVKQEWAERSGEIQRKLAKIPRATEIWFVVCYPKAEEVVGQFARKALEVDLAWDADIRKFAEYIGKDSQNAADWSQRRLQQALQGVFRTKVLFLPTNALVACVAAFGKQNRKRHGVTEGQIVPPSFLEQLTSDLPNPEWVHPSKAIQFVKTSPLYYQLTRTALPFGQRRGNPRTQENAKPLFERINQYIRSESGDQYINECLALGLRSILGLDENQVYAEKPHPWLDSIRPDITIKDNERKKIICVEMHYTLDRRPYILANYVLQKMDRYMKQFEHYMLEPKMQFFTD